MAAYVPLGPAANLGQLPAGGAALVGHAQITATIQIGLIQANAPNRPINLATTPNTIIRNQIINQEHEVACPELFWDMWCTNIRQIIFEFEVLMWKWRQQVTQVEVNNIRQRIDKIISLGNAVRCGRTTIHRWLFHVDNF
ncbi:hypothetical protein Dda_6962 [Drechslerella dactyloides]|uniref:Uncharacterized protein n=1 Tax=Drechslerella dactyloides TaxID=74499 RepID=A0AAD6ISW7_DREDA|nr:hypothetical protein Dda_6962 [Drechslerella dactyloides]